MILSLLLAVLTAGCDRDDDGEQTRDRPIERGDTVVVERSAASFFQGRVLSATTESLRVQAADGAPITVGRGDAYRLPARRRQWSVGDYGICRVGDLDWIACRVVRADARLEVAALDGKNYVVAASDALTPTAVTRMNIERAFAAAREQARFAAEADRAGGPEPPQDWRPTEREPVVARVDEVWLSGRVQEVGDGGVTVLLLGADESVRLAHGAVVPEPPYAEKVPRPGHFVLFPPPTPAEPWPVGRVEAVTGSQVVLRDFAGAEHRIASRRVIPLGR